MNMGKIQTRINMEGIWNKQSLHFPQLKKNTTESSFGLSPLRPLFTSQVVTVC